MARDSPKEGKTAVFPSKLKSFMRDVASLKRSHSGSQRPQTAESVVSSEQAWSIETDFPEEQPHSHAGISVQLSLSFDSPLDFCWNRCYNSSADFRPSEQLLRGLVRRIDHGSYELITRKDPNASTATRSEGRPKPKRFEMTFQISQKGSLWASRTYKSYQRAELSAEAIKEIILSSHRLIGLFLRRHDPGFVWKDGPIRDEILEAPELSPYRVGGIQPMNCVPRSRFLEESQTFEVIPGFSLELTLTSRSQRCKPQWQKTIQIDSEQTTPLNLAVAEALFSNASYAMEAALRPRRKAIEERHRHRCGFISGICQHYEDDATEISLRVNNNLGPKFDHLHRTMYSKLVLISHPEAKETVDLVNSLERAMEDARDSADHTTNEINDLDFRIVELRGKGWHLDEPLVFTLGPSDSYSRRSVQAILDRVQSGVADTLRGNAATVRMTAAKRGHFILDKTLVAREPAAASHRWVIPSKNKAKVVSRLNRRIQQDIDMICKDTCSLDNLDEVAAEEGKSAFNPDMSSAFDQSEMDTSELRPETPSSPAAQTPKHMTGTPFTPTLSPSPWITRSNDHQDVPLSPDGSVFSDKSRRASVICPKTGVRAFPLVPTTSSYGFTDMPVLSSPKPEAKQPEEPTSPSTADDIPSDRKEGQTIKTGEAENALENSENNHVKSRELESNNQEPRAENAEAHDSQTPSVGAKDESEVEERRASTITVDSHKRKEADELSLTPSTPSLVYGGGHSARSSILFTPHIQAVTSGMDSDPLVAPGTPESHIDDQVPVSHVELESDQKPPKLNPSGSPSRMSSTNKPRPAPSPLQHQSRNSDESKPEDSTTVEVEDVKSGVEASEGSQEQMTRPTDQSRHLSSVAQEAEVKSSPGPASVEVEWPASSRKAEIDSQGEKKALAAEAPVEEGPVEKPPAEQKQVKTGPNFYLDSAPSSNNSSPVVEQVAVAPVAITFTEEPRTPTDNVVDGIETPSDGFAQTRQDFDFSSPWTVSTPFSEDRRYAHLDEAIEDDERTSQDPAGHSTNLLIPRSMSSSLVRPPFRTRKSSFGSAGLLGFRYGEPRLIEIGLRRALMIPIGGGGTLSRPRTATSFFNSMNYGRDAASLPQRPASSGKELELAKGPASSAGKEVNYGEVDMDSGVMKKAASSNMLQDMVLVQSKDEGRKDKKEIKPGEGHRNRSGSLMFLIAGATMASQMIGSGSS
ncbi:hypothetical protein JX265_004791 [Neoarthrinium moseri]|uniref:Pt repeat family protein n=1 Tax=Neoarthrinium moseri TaxID=1658444 RepID=A0A9P9WQE5_9PEZI|nr:hypothetical protein JX265_004791 [Neoarthrinium moseri]